MEVSPSPVGCSGQIHIVGNSRIQDRITVFAFLAKFWLPKGKLIFNSFNHKSLNSFPLSFMIKSLFVTFELSSWVILCKLIIYKPSLGKRDTKEPPLWWVLSTPALDIGLAQGCETQEASMLLELEISLTNGAPGTAQYHEISHGKIMKHDRVQEKQWIRNLRSTTRQ